MIGLLADLLGANRKLIEKLLFRVKDLQFAENSNSEKPVHGVAGLIGPREIRK
jgi:hypothetical protein